MARTRPAAGRAGRRSALFLVALLALSLTGCVRGCTSSRPPIHINPNMDDQPRLNPQGESGFFYDGAEMQPPVPGTVARGDRLPDDPFLTGKDGDGNFLLAPPVTVDEALLARGEQRYGIYCAPCHDARGTGRGIVYEYGSVPTANFFDEQRRALSVGEIYDTLVNGKGLMSGYRYPIPPADRWAIVAHIRRMQDERPVDVAAAP